MMRDHAHHTGEGRSPAAYFRHEVNVSNANSPGTRKWGHHAGLSRSLISAKAVELIDRDGLDALSLERLAKELGVRTPSLYGHFGNKEDVLRSATRRIINETPVVALESVRDWRPWLVEGGLNLRATMLRHPEATTLIIRYYPYDMLLRHRERAISVLDEAGVDPAQHLLVVEGVEKLTLGFSISAPWMIDVDDEPPAALTEHPATLRAWHASRHDPLGLFVDIAMAFVNAIPDRWSGPSPN